MPQAAWSVKRDQQYERIQEGLEDRGHSEDESEEIAARTVNKERARAGEARTVNRSSIRDISSGRRGSPRSHKGEGGRTYDQLYNQARRRQVKGGSRMNNAELERAVSRWVRRRPSGPFHMGLCRVGDAPGVQSPGATQPGEGDGIPWGTSPAVIVEEGVDTRVRPPLRGQAIHPPGEMPFVVAGAGPAAASVEADVGPVAAPA